MVSPDCSDDDSLNGADSPPTKKKKLLTDAAPAGVDLLFPDPDPFALMNGFSNLENPSDNRED